MNIWAALGFLGTMIWLWAILVLPNLVVKWIKAYQWWRLTPEQQYEAIAPMLRLVTRPAFSDRLYKQIANDRKQI